MNKDKRYYRRIEARTVLDSKNVPRVSGIGENGSLIYESVHSASSPCNKNGGVRVKSPRRVNISSKERLIKEIDQLDLKKSLDLATLIDIDTKGLTVPYNFDDKTKRIASKIINKRTINADDANAIVAHLNNKIVVENNRKYAKVSKRKYNNFMKGL